MDAANTYVLTYAYVANADRVSSVTTTAAGATVATQTYTYNARNQITKELVQDGTPTTTWERDYTYTASGLRTKIDDLFNEWDSTFAHDPAGRLSLIQTTDNSGATKANPFPWWEGDTHVSTSPNGDVVSMVSGSNRITYRYDEEMRLVEAEMASGDAVAVTYDGMGSLVSIVQGATTQKTLTYQGRILQTRNAADAIQDKLFWAGNNLMRVNLNAAARNQARDARGSNIISYQTDGTMDKTRLWDWWGLEVFAAGAGSAPDVGFLSNFDLGSSGLSLTPRNNAWWAELGRSVEGGWHPKFVCPGGTENEDGPDLFPCYECFCCTLAPPEEWENADKHCKRIPCGSFCPNDPYVFEQDCAGVPPDLVDRLRGDFVDACKLIEACPYLPDEVKKCMVNRCRRTGGSPGVRFRCNMCLEPKTSVFESPRCQPSDVLASITVCPLYVDLAANDRRSRLIIHELYHICDCPAGRECLAERRAYCCAASCSGLRCCHNILGGSNCWKRNPGCDCCPRTKSGEIGGGCACSPARGCVGGWW